MAGRVTFDALDGRTRMTVLTRFVDAEQMQKMLDMGMHEGMTAAIDQIDAVLESAVV